MLSIELTNLAEMLDATKKAHNISVAAKKYSSTIKNAIWNSTVVNNIFAYETNGKEKHKARPHRANKIGQVSVEDMLWTTPTFQ